MPTAPQVVVIGAGFGGLQAARLLVRSRAEVLLIDRNNYHTFFPLLYQVAAAELEPEDIIYPVRSTLRRHKNFRLVVDEVSGLDLEKRRVRTANYEFPYDYLVLAAGSTSHYFSVEGAAANTFSLKNIADAVSLRNHILLCFERALYLSLPEERRRLLTFAIIGGGPTGVEYAGALAELIRGPLARDYPGIDPAAIRLRLLEAAPHLLPGLPLRLQTYAERRLRKMGVEVRLGARVTHVSPDHLVMEDGERFPTQTAIWTAGVRGAPLPRVDGLSLLGNGQVCVLPTLQVQDHPEVYIIGDLAHSEKNGHPLPLTAPVAMQEGRAAARNILRQMSGREPVPFRFRDQGTLAAIGRNAAAVHVFGLNFTGFVAWLLWLGVHIYRLIGFRNRLLVLVDWAWDYLFFERGVRLIVSLPAEQRNLEGGER